MKNKEFEIVIIITDHDYYNYKKILLNAKTIIILEEDTN